MLALAGVSFLTPLGALFALAAAVPLAALVLTERHAQRVRQALAVTGPGRRALVPVALALALLPALVAVAAAQPVVVRQQLVAERGDAEAFFVFDTSRSMTARAAAGAPTRLERAKRLALRLRAQLPDVPVGIASVTDRALPNVMPTTDPALFASTLEESVGIDRPPPSQLYKGRATTFEALVPLLTSHFFSATAKRRLVVVFTDGESSKVTPYLLRTLRQQLEPVLVHVWAPGEEIFVDGRPDPHYGTDPTSTAALDQLSQLTGGAVVSESQFGRLAQVARADVGRGGTTRRIDAYARVALAPWFLLGGVLPLGFLLWRRNA